LTLSGAVEKFADVQPERVFLNGRMGDPVSASVRIVPRPDYPFKIKNVRTKTGQHIRPTVAIREDGGKSYYELTVNSSRQQPGRIVDVVYLDTDSPVRPQIAVPVFGQIVPASRETP
jgi:hypothetical protein